MTIFANRFAGQGAIVTGGASGIGRDIATRLVAEGARVCVWDRSPGAESSAMHQITVDVTNPGEVDAAMAESLKALGKLDVMVVSAGITGPNATVAEYPTEGWLQVMDVNLNGAFYCNRAAVRSMMPAGYGRIVNIASIAGKEGNPNASAYSASKAGLIALTKSLGKELAKTEIRVNCVTPAAANTPIFAQMSQAHIDFMLSKIPAGRFAEIGEITALVCWLASGECSFSTGAVFDVSGGRGTY
jgi:NAD(P)-dependent dehydrogenase (short-subunit alcohol dehydrogenase family)